MTTSPTQSENTKENTLHLMRLSAFKSDALANCLLVLNPHDTIVLIDDGCYCLHHPLFKSLLDDNTKVALFMVDTHANARAIKVLTEDLKSSKSTTNAIQLLSMNELVKLTFSHHHTITWQC